MGKINLSGIKAEIQKAGTNKRKIMYFKEDSKVRVRFLTDLEEGMEIPFHDSFALGVNVPCQEVFGRECEYCEDDKLRTRNMYVWSVYDYESKEVKLIVAATNNCSPVPAFASLYESYGTLTDRDYEIKRVGKQQNTTFSVIPLEKVKFRSTKIKSLSEQAVLKIIDKAHPTDNVEEDEEKTKKGSSAREKPEDDWEDDEKENNYEEMTAKELYGVCREREIECKPKKSKEYYVDILEEQDLESDDWEEDEWSEEE